MRRDFFPDRETDMLTWSGRFSAKITADPEAYGLTAAQAAEYALLDAAFAAAYRRAIDPSTRTRPAVMAKNDARKVLEAAARRLNRVVQGAATVTAEQKANLGLCTREPARAPLLPVPKTAPSVRLVSMDGLTAVLRLSDPNSASLRARPGGVGGAEVYAYAGAQPPGGVTGWMFVGQSPTTEVEVTLGGLPPGTKVWLTARWTNPRGEAGPTANAVVAYTGAGLAVGGLFEMGTGRPATRGSRTRLRMAA